MNLLRDRWRSDAAFRVVAIAAAVGAAGAELPGLAYGHGGGAVFVPLLIAAWLVVRPLLALEFGLGLCYQGSPPEVLRKLARRWDWVGWWNACVGGLVALVHAALATWLLMYAWDALMALLADQAPPWGATLEAAQAYARQAMQEAPLDAPATAAASVRPVGTAVLCLALIWLVVHGVVAGGAARVAIAVSAAFGIGLALVAVAGAVIVTRAGAMDGIVRLLSPDWRALLEPATWTASAGLVVRASAIGCGVHVTLASFLNRNADGVGSAALVVALSVAASAAVALVIAAALGVQAAAGGVPLESLPVRGLDGLFTAVPAAFAAATPWLGSAGACALYGGLGLLVLAAAMPPALAATTAVVDRADLVWREASARIAVAAFLAGLPAATGHGWHARQMLAGWLLPAGMAPAAAALALVVAWGIGIDGVQRHLNAYSVRPVRSLWRWRVAAGAPLALMLLAIDGACRQAGGIGETPAWASLTLGAAPCLAAVLFAVTVAVAAPRRLAP